MRKVGKLQILNPTRETLIILRLKMSSARKPARPLPNYTVPAPVIQKGVVHQAMTSGSGDHNQYLLHQSGGEGVTVFVMDMGFDVENDAVRSELRFPSPPPLPPPSSDQQPSTLKTNHFIVPLATFLGTDIPSSILYDPKHDSHLRDTLISDIHTANTQRAQTGRINKSKLPGSVDPSHGHGTQLASLALGTKYGIAPKARLYPVKVGSCLWNTHPTHQSSRRGEEEVVGKRNQGEWQHHLEPGRYQPWSAAFKHIIQVVKDGKMHGKAVVLCSTGHERIRLQGWNVNRNGQLESRGSGSSSHGLEDKWVNVFRGRIQELADLGVAFVCSAGNNGYKTGEGGCEMVRHIGDLIPGCLADDTSCRTPICVGAVDRLGRASGDTSLEGSWDREFDAKVGIWALGEGVKCLGFGGVVSEVGGTSYSAAVVAGLVAYILGHPSSVKDPELQWNNDPDRGFVVLNRLRKILHELSYERVPLDKQDALASWNAQGGKRELKNMLVNVAYNGARGPQNSV